MYQRSRQMLVFLVVTFLAVQVTCGVLSAIASRGTSSGKLWFYASWAHQVYDMSIRGRYPLWCSHVQWGLSGRCPIAALGIRHCMGDPHIVSCSLDCCKTLSRIARTTNKMDCRGFFQGAIKNSSVLLCKVRCSLTVSPMWLSNVSRSTSTLVLLLFLPWSSSICPQRSWCANLWLISD